MPGASEEYSRISTTIQVYLWNFVREHKLGEVYNSDARYAVGADGETVRMVDASFVQANRVTKGVVTMSFGPDLAVEVLSESNSVTDIEKRPKNIANPVANWYGSSIRKKKKSIFTGLGSFNDKP